MAQKIQFPQHYRKSFNKWPKIFSSKSGNEKKILIFFQNILISSIRSYEHVEWSFENSVESEWTKCWKIVDRSQIVIIRPSFFQKISLSSNWSKGQIKCSFDKPTNFFDRKPKTFYSWSEKRKKTISVFRKNIFLRHDPIETKGGILTTPPKFFRLKSWFFCSIYEHVARIEHFSKKIFLPEVVSLDSRIQFWQPQRFFYRMLIFSKKLVFFQLVPTNT